MAQTNVASGPMYKTNFAFAVMLIGMVGYFIYWGLGYTNHNHTTMFLLAVFRCVHGIQYRRKRCGQFVWYVGWRRYFDHSPSFDCGCRF